MMSVIILCASYGGASGCIPDRPLGAAVMPAAPQQASASLQAAVLVAGCTQAVIPMAVLLAASQTVCWEQLACLLRPSKPQQAYKQQC